MCFGYIGKRNTHISYGITIQNKNTWLSRSRMWMSLNFYFHRYLFFIRVGLICRKQRRFCNCVHVFPRCFFIRSVENIIATFSEFLVHYFRFFVSFLLSSLDLSVVLLYFKETTLKYSPRQNSAFDLESINWCDQIVERLSLIQSFIIIAEKLIIPLIHPNSDVCGKAIVSRNTQNKLRIVSGKRSSFF